MYLISLSFSKPLAFSWFLCFVFQLVASSDIVSTLIFCFWIVYCSIIPKYNSLFQGAPRYRMVQDICDFRAFIRFLFLWTCDKTLSVHKWHLLLVLFDFSSSWKSNVTLVYFDLFKCFDKRSELFQEWSYFCRGYQTTLF